MYLLWLGWDTNWQSISDNFPKNHFKPRFITFHAHQFPRVWLPHLNYISGSVHINFRITILYKRIMEYQVNLPPELDVPSCDDILAGVNMAQVTSEPPN